jgi:hypothetical protein
MGVINSTGWDCVILSTHGFENYWIWTKIGLLLSCIRIQIRFANADPVTVTVKLISRKYCTQSKKFLPKISDTTIPTLPPYHCSESVTFWYGSGSRSSDPYLWLTDPDPALLNSYLQDATWKLFFFLSFFCLFLFTVHTVIAHYRYF